MYSENETMQYMHTCQSCGEVSPLLRIKVISESREKGVVKFLYLCPDCCEQCANESLKFKIA